MPSGTSWPLTDPEGYGHIRMFEAWANEAHTLVWVYEETPPRAVHRVVVYDDRLPNIMVVLSADPKSEYGRKGIGYLAVRYYDPVTCQFMLEDHAVRHSYHHLAGIRAALGQAR